MKGAGIGLPGVVKNDHRLDFLMPVRGHSGWVLFFCGVVVVIFGA